jgi:hypothetical protein
LFDPVGASIVLFGHLCDAVKEKWQHRDPPMDAEIYAKELKSEERRLQAVERDLQSMIGVRLLLVSEGDDTEYHDLLIASMEVQLLAAAKRQRENRPLLPSVAFNRECKAAERLWREYSEKRRGSKGCAPRSGTRPRRSGPVR